MAESVKKHELSVQSVDGIIDGTVTATLARILQLVGDAIVIFDVDGRVLLANDEAVRLFGWHEEDFVGSDIRTYFAPGTTEVESTAFSPESLPFALDGSTALVTVSGAAGEPLALRVRSERVGTPTEAFVLVAAPVDNEVISNREELRTIEDLHRANKRLSGALHIVLDTLDSENMGQLLERVLTEISDTMEADGALIYLAENDGFHLHGVTESVSRALSPRFVRFGHTIEKLCSDAGHALRLRIMPPDHEDLRNGHLDFRSVVNDDTREVYAVATHHLPPFMSFIAVPVWFGGQIIALIEVGWKTVHPLSSNDTRLLDSISNYLSVQLVGALSAMRTQRRAELRELSVDIRNRLLAAANTEGKSAFELLPEIMQEIAEALDAVVFPVGWCEVSGKKVVHPTKGSVFELPADLGEDLTKEEEAQVVAVAPESELSEALHALGQPCVGAALLAGKLEGACRTWLFLREYGSEPMSDIDLELLSRVAVSVRAIVAGAEESQQNKRISQALMTGMKNELQHVDGIDAQGIYSSATAEAFVGGDFYSLVRLSGRRACIIMGDVSGKGIEAASVSSAVKTALSAYAWEGIGPARMVANLNEFLLGFSRVETFATLFVGVVDLAKGVLTYCSAGHPPAALVRAATGEAQLLDVQSGVVGAFQDMTYKNGYVELHKDDILFLYTDGTTEARSPEGAFFGETGLRDMVMSEVPRGFEGLLDRFLATLDSYTGRRLEDDVAMVALRFSGLLS